MSKIGLQGFKGCPRFSSPVVMDSKRQQDKLKKEQQDKLKLEQHFEKPSDVRHPTSDKRVVIIGKGLGWHKAPYAVDGEIWGVNNICLRQTVDLAFNMHDLDKHKDHPLFKKTIEHVNKQRILIVTQKMYKHIPTSIAFPLWKMPRKYFTNSIDYMLAYVWYHNQMLIELSEEIREKITHHGKLRLITQVDMYGIVMATGTEYTVQRPSLEYWIGRVEGQGGEVTIHEPTYVCKCSKGLYGYDWDEEDEPHVLKRFENKYLREKGDGRDGKE